MNFVRALSLGEKEVISIVGAGGKTSLMYALAHELAASNRKVLTTTTTKIFMPTHEESPVTIVTKVPEYFIDKARSALKDYFHLTVGAEYLPLHGKLLGVHPDFLKHIRQSSLFDYILIEADGAARKSLKACASHEPIVPFFTNRLVSLIGLDVVGKPLDEQWVFRSTIFSKITNLPLNQKVTEEAVANITIHNAVKIAPANKDMQRIVFLNKADNNQLFKTGERIAAILRTKGADIFHRVVIGTLGKEPTILYCEDII